MQSSNSEVSVRVERIVQGLPLGKYDGPSIRACSPPAQAVAPIQAPLKRTRRTWLVSDVQALLDYDRHGLDINTMARLLRREVSSVQIKLAALEKVNGL